MLRLILLFGFASVTTAGPCDDSLFLALSRVSIDSMTANQAVYFATVKSQCDEELAREARERQEQQQSWRDDMRRERQAEEIKSKAATGVVCAVLGVIVLGVAIFFISRGVAQNRIDKARSNLPTY